MNPADLASLAQFKGFGNLDGPLWFVGLEEGFGERPGKPGWSPEWEVAVRSGWSSVMDARDACDQLGDPYWLSRNYSHVWRVFGKLARGLIEREADWADTDKAHTYVINELGRASNSTFMGELMPLPAKGLDHWPYGAVYAERQDYETDVWPRRKEHWTGLIEQHAPSVVCCYGGVKNGHWPKYEELFEGATWSDIAQGRVRTTLRENGTRIYLLRFFGQGQYRTEDLRLVVEHAASNR